MCLILIDFNESLFNTIELLLGDMNLKVKLAAAIAIFNMLKNFHKPLNCKYQQVIDRVNFLKYCIQFFFNRKMIWVWVDVFLG